MNHLFTLPITPIAAPRQIKSDMWAPRKCVVNYRIWQNTIIPILPPVAREMERPYFVFLMPMPPSWSGAKKRRMEGQPHRQKPDLDNMIKAILDTVYRGADDSHVWSVGACKRWAVEGAIQVYEQEEIILSDAA